MTFHYMLHAGWEKSWHTTAYMRHRQLLFCSVLVVLVMSGLYYFNVMNFLYYFVCRFCNNTFMTCVNVYVPGSVHITLMFMLCLCIKAWICTFSSVKYFNSRLILKGRWSRVCLFTVCSINSWWDILLFTVAGINSWWDILAERKNIPIAFLPQCDYCYKLKIICMF